MTAINQSSRDYHRWLEAELGPAFVEADLPKKFRKMAAGPFSFLRATYWRWAETVLDVCPELGDAPAVLGVGDIHLENFGTWRDADGRLVWGVNDFDEAAEMPFVLDIVRLVVSAILARARGSISARDVCKEILSGYKEGLEQPCPFVLDERHKALRKRVVVPESERKAFWRDLQSGFVDDGEPPLLPFVIALQAAVPEPPLRMEFRRRAAGTGSLGRLRIVGWGSWRGGRVIREAKAGAPSGWQRAHGKTAGPLRCLEAGTGLYRDPDPWLRMEGRVILRRLSPNNRKIEVEDGLDLLLSPRMLCAMGHDLASVHAATGGQALIAHLRNRRKGWLFDAAAKMVAMTIAEQKEFEPLWNHPGFRDAEVGTLGMSPPR